MPSNHYHLLVIGGGPAGFFAAITAKRECPIAQVGILESGGTFLAKVRISGGGRCNVTHACFDPATLTSYYPRGSKALRGAFARFQPRDTMAWFAAEGITLKTEADNRVFPASDRADTIVTSLLQAAQDSGVSLHTAAKAVRLQKVDGLFHLTLQSGKLLTSRYVLVATGGGHPGHRLAQSLGHTIIPPVPSLFTFKVDDPALHALAGIGVPWAHLTLETHDLRQQATGPLLLTHWGLSGPAILKLSAFAARALHQTHYRAHLHIRWLPEALEHPAQVALQNAKSNQPKRTVANDRQFALPSRLWRYLCQKTGISSDTRWNQLSRKELHQLAATLNKDSYAITGKGAFKEEFVTCGGIDLNEVTMRTMESKPCPGLFLAGEVLDLDGLTGGFNLQSAWTTGWLAGSTLAERLRHPNED